MNRVLAHCGARVPILQSPMGWIARSALTSAVSRAGGLGVIETSSGETAHCRLPALAGQLAGLVHAVKPVQAIIDDTGVEPPPGTARRESRAASREPLSRSAAHPRKPHRMNDPCSIL